ncbi:ATP-dependent zinc protease [Methylophaga sp. OBS4]|uniref:retropepsin-like aspartic peptidase RloA3 n=1 Tax=Methylophaga sp. OBS4 TaxID=2991935 RepID=UPI00224E497A|nr:ATP-dependent zinc protease [Methylophaga sp. OBS4]MCX4187397.1 ATP-dependent zinc protease [Methylophaga sp. OBS4]
MIRKLFSIFGIVAWLAGFSHVALAEQAYGWIEKIKVQPWGVEAKAKLDTGALTSSMHAEDIERFERDGEDWVRFTVDLGDNEVGERVKQRIERPLLRDFSVRGAGGRDKRSVVLMQVCIGNTVFEEQFSLRNRDNMLYPILLGRRTIQHLGPVDVTRTHLIKSECGSDSPILSYNELESGEGIGFN